MDVENIVKQDDELAKIILSEMYNDAVFNDLEREEKAIKDIKWMLQFIVEGFKVNNTKIVENLIIWLKRLFKGLDIEAYHVDLLFQNKKVLEDKLHNDEINSFLNQIVIEDLRDETLLLKNNPYEKEQKAYLDAILSSNRIEAQLIVSNMIDRNISVEDIYLYILQETMRIIGVLWHDGVIQVGREHYATVVTQYIMSMLYNYVFNSNPKKYRMVASAVGSELHEMGIRMVADIFEMKGWDTMYLGANIPVQEIIDVCRDFKPNVIALSITMPYHLSALRETIDSIRSTKELKDVKIIVGGLPFINNSKLCNSFPVDAVAFNALEGVKIAEELLR